MDHHNFGSGHKNSKSDYPDPKGQENNKVRTLTEFSFQPCMCPLPAFPETQDDDTYKKMSRKFSQNKVYWFAPPNRRPVSNPIQVFPGY